MRNLLTKDVGISRTNRSCPISRTLTRGPSGDALKGLSLAAIQKNVMSLGDDIRTKVINSGMRIAFFLNRQV